MTIALLVRPGLQHALFFMEALSLGPWLRWFSNWGRSHLEKMSFKYGPCLGFCCGPGHPQRLTQTSITFTFIIHPGSLETSQCRFLTAETRKGVGADFIGIQEAFATDLPSCLSGRRLTLLPSLILPISFSQCCSWPLGSLPPNQVWP